MWEQLSSHGDFMGCENARLRVRENAKSGLQDTNDTFARLTPAEVKQVTSDPETRRNMEILTARWRRVVHAECWAVR